MCTHVAKPQPFCQLSWQKCCHIISVLNPMDVFQGAGSYTSHQSIMWHISLKAPHLLCLSLLLHSVGDMCQSLGWVVYTEQRMRWLKTTGTHKLSGTPSRVLALLGFPVQESRGICCLKFSLARQEGSVTRCVPSTAWVCVWSATRPSGRCQYKRHLQWTRMRFCWRSSLLTKVNQIF